MTTSSRSTDSNAKMAAVAEARNRVARRGQIWYLDFIIGALILFTMVAVFFVNINHLENSKSTNSPELLRQGTVIADGLMTAGSPSGWSSSNVARLGIIDSQRVNLTLLDNFEDVPYTDARKLLRLTDQFDFFFERKDGCLMVKNGTALYGNPDLTVSLSACTKRTDIDTSTTKNLVSLTRYVLYEGTPVRMVVYVWN